MISGDGSPLPLKESAGRQYEISQFTSMKRCYSKEYKQLPKRVRRYYQKQNELIECYEDIVANQYSLDQAAGENILRKASVLAKASLGLNVLLMISKAVAAGLSGSLSVISSLVDSIMDLASGALFWYTSRKIKNISPYSYPTGRTRLEPVAIVILSVIMAVAAFQLIVESTRDIIGIADRGGATHINFDTPTLSVLAATMLSKTAAYFVCRSVDSPSTQALAQDHRNDVLSNAIAATCGFVAFHYWAYLDPMGAIAISLYIIVNWWQTGAEQVRMLTGHAAKPEFINRVTWLSLGHDQRIQQIDTVRAYHSGNEFFVEVHIVLPEDMTLKEAHDIGEPLQQKIEQLPEVARAFVHLDYETDHDPTKEHRMPFG